MYERFTDRSRKVMHLANQEAMRQNRDYIDTGHILVGMIKEGSGIAANVLRIMEVDGSLLKLVRNMLPTKPDNGTVVMGRLPHSPAAKDAVSKAVEEARNLNHDYVGTEHLLLGLIGVNYGTAAEAMSGLGIEPQKVRGEVMNLLGLPEIPTPEGAVDELNAYIEKLRADKQDRQMPPHPGPGYTATEPYYLDPREYELVSDKNPAAFSFTVAGNLKAGWKRLGPVQVIDGTLYLEMGR